MAALAASAALALAILYFSGPAAPELSTTRFFVPTATTAQPADLNVSPDGRHVAFIAQGAASADALWVRTLDQFEAREIPGTEGANEPFWSPDSRFVGFFADGTLRKIDITGGPPQNLSDVPTSNLGGGTWSSEGTILFSSNHAGGSYLIHRIADAGGVPTPVTQLNEERRDTNHDYPKFLPDGQHFLLSVWIGNVVGIHIGSLDSDDTVPLIENAAMAGYTDAGYVLFVRDRVLMAQPFDANALELADQPFPVADQVLYNPVSGHAAYSVSGGGVLAYRSGVSVPPEPVWFDRTGRRLGKVEEAGAYNQFWLSPNEERMAAISEGDIWVVDLLRGSRSRFTFDPAVDRYPIWSPRGDRIVFSSQRLGGEDLFVKSSMGTGEAEVLLDTEEAKFPTDWSGDGRYVLYTNRSVETARDVWALPVDGEGDPFPVLQTPFREWHAMFSPDGNWIAYDSNETGRDEVYVQPFPPTGGKWQISVQGGHMPRWREDGRELFFVSADLKLMAVEVDAGERFSHGIPEDLFRPNLPAINTRYRVTDNGQRFLMRSLPPTATIPPINVVVNWTAELQQQ